MVETYNRISRIPGGRGLRFEEMDAVSGKFPSFSPIPLIFVMEDERLKGIGVESSC